MQWAKVLVLLVLLVLLGASGCAGASAVKARAAADMSCPEKDIEVTGLEMGSYEASGCGKRMRYIVRGGEAMPDSVGE